MIPQKQFINKTKHMHMYTKPKTKNNKNKLTNTIKQKYTKTKEY